MSSVIGQDEGKDSCGVSQPVSTIIETSQTTANDKALPNGWRRARLGDVCEIIARQVDPKLPQYGSLPHINGENILSGLCRLAYLNTASEESMTSGKYLFEAGDVLYSKLRPYLRKAVVAEVDGVCSADMYPIKVNRDVLDPHFAAWLLVSDEFTNYADSESRRARMPKLNREQLFAFSAPLPPLNEQKRLVIRINEIMAAVEQARAAAEVQLKTAKDLPVAYLREVFDSPKAKRWRKKRIDELAKTCSGSTPSRTRADYYVGTIPWVKTGELRDDFISDTEEHVSEAALQECSIKLLPADTLLIAMYGQGQTRGRTGLLTKPATTNQACFAILPNPDEFDSQYLQLWFRHNYSRLRRETEGRGGNQPNLNGEVLNRQQVPLPALEEQQSIVKAVTVQLMAAERVHERLQDQFDSINKLPAALLRQAFTGTL
jgi:type I restriction enzyme S subunit